MSLERKVQAKRLVSVLIDMLAKISNKSWCDEHFDGPNKKAQEKTEREEDCWLENLDTKACLLC